MKKLLFLPFLVSAGMLFGQYQQGHKMTVREQSGFIKRPAGKLKPGSPVASHMEKAGGDVIWSNEFEDAGEWTAAGPGSDYEHNGWSLGTTVSNSWAFDTGDMGTSGNFARFVNNDGSQGTQINDGPFTLTCTETINLTGVEAPYLEFDQYGAWFADSQAVQISLNGTDWITVALNNDQFSVTEFGGVPYERPMTRRFVLSPYLSGDLSAVRIRLYWNGGVNGEETSYFSYGWFVDNLRILEGYEKDIAIKRVYTSIGETGTQYTILGPGLIDAAVQMSFGAEIENFGREQVEVELEVSNSSGFQQLSPVTVISPFAADSLYIATNEGYSVPAVPGEYDFTFRVQDANRIRGMVVSLDDETLTGGTAYTDAVNIPVVGGTGSGLTVDITTDGNGVITQLLVNQSGVGYSVGDEVTITTGDENASILVVQTEDETMEYLLDDTMRIPFKVVDNYSYLGEYGMAVDQYDGTPESISGAFTGWSSSLFEPGIGVKYEILKSAAICGIQVGIAPTEQEENYIGNYVFAVLFKYDPLNEEYHYIDLSYEYILKSSDFGGLVDLYLKSELYVEPGEIILAVACFFTGSEVPIAFSGYTLSHSVVGVGHGEMVTPVPTNNFVEAPVVRLNTGNCTIGIEEYDPLVSEVTLYPNPSTEKATLSYTTERETLAYVEVSDLSGKVVYRSGQERVLSGTHTTEIPVTHLSVGMYTCTLITGETRVHQKLVVQK